MALQNCNKGFCDVFQMVDIPADFPPGRSYFPEKIVKFPVGDILAHSQDICFIVEFRNVSFEARNIGFDLDHVGLEFGDIGLDLNHVGFELGDISLDLDHVGLKLRDITFE